MRAPPAMNYDMAKYMPIELNSLERNFVGGNQLLYDGLGFRGIARILFRVSIAI